MELDFTDAWCHFRDVLAAEYRRPATIETYQHWFRHFEQWCRLQGYTCLPQDKTVVARYVAELPNQLLPGGRKLKPNSVLTALAALKSLYVHLARVDKSANAAAFVRLPRRARERPLRQILNRTQMKNLIEAADAGPYAQRDRCLINLLCTTGSRSSEARLLLWEDVDLLRRTLRIHGKGGKDRTVPIAARLLADLQSLRASRSGDEKQPVFESREGGPVSRDTIYRVLRRANQRAQLRFTEIFPHMLRYSFACALADNAVPIERISHLLGHSSVDETMRYLGPYLEDRSYDQRILDELFNDDEPEPLAETSLT